MLKKMRERKGFTLAELLIVVAIIGVLVAIAIPIFTAQLEKSRDAVTASNMRAAYAEASVAKLTEETTGKASYNSDDGTVTVADVGIKGESGDGSAFADDGAFDLPFSLASGVGAKLDNKTTAGADEVDVVFTWTGDTCSASIS